VALTWDNNNKIFSVYLDGVYKASSSALSTSYTLSSSGKLQFGTDLNIMKQSSCYYTYYSNDARLMSAMLLANRVLLATEISILSSVSNITNLFN
jgi:hypothetical protein